jgi:K+-sensing histidine kinase KdpD
MQARDAPDADQPADHGGFDTSGSDGLMGVLAHELRTPITTIYAGSAVLARDEGLLPAMRQELAADVSAEAARLFRAVEDLLVLTRLEHGALVLAREPVALARAVEAAVQLEAIRWPRLRVAVRTGGPQPPVAADPAALAHALRNLIANVGWRAVDGTELEIVVRVGYDQVECALLDRSGTLVGQDLSSLFDLPIRDPLPGMSSPGIAMYVAASLIRTMRGAIWARPVEDGQGVELGFSLPRYVPAP